MTVAPFLSFVVTALFMFGLRPVALAAGLVDVPGGRKRHADTVPLIGGIAMSIGLGVGTALIAGEPTSWAPILVGIYLLVVVGTIDDRFDLPANVRLIAQSCAALLVVFASGIVVTSLGRFFGHELVLGAAGGVFTILFVVTLVNAFNVIDGIDGLAGGLALLGLTLLAITSLSTPFFPLLAVAVSVVAAYLLFNLPLGLNAPVRAFMGDAGSTSLGLMVATFGIYLTQGRAAIITPSVGLWFVAVPVFDLFSTIVRRTLRKRSPLSPDQEHLHHVLAENGLSRRATLVVILSLAVLFAAVGFLGHVLKADDGVLLALWLAAGVGYYQVLRFPRVAVAAISWLRRLGTHDFGDDLSTE